ncbi:MAG: outer membrane protein assembly factor BamD [Nitrospirae bacterium]|nr:outer membrane protein assembly factor BamD [Nitrospirota bacterium]
MRNLLLFAMVLSLTVGCSSAPKPSAPGAKSLSGTDEQIFIGDTIEKNYDPNVIMKRAEAFFEKEDYPEAIIEYQHFLDLHRVHVLAPYAQFKLGESHFKRVKTVDRDPEPVHKALEAFQKLLKDYPGSRHEAEATDRIHACHELIAQAHLLVGQFYYRREAYLAASHRFETILTQYPEMDVAADALYYLALTYNDLGADDWAREKAMLLAERYPNKYAKESRRLLAELNSRRPAEAVTLSEAQPNGAAPVALSRATGSQAQVSSQPPVVAPVTSRRSTSNGVIAPQPTLCRLGVAC